MEVINILRQICISMLFAVTNACYSFHFDYLQEIVLVRTNNAAFSLQVKCSRELVRHV